MIQVSKSADEWSGCPAGTLQGLARQLHQRRRRARLQRCAAVASCACLAAVIGAWTLGRFDSQPLPQANPATAALPGVESFPKKLTCRDVDTYAERYLAGKLPAEFEERFRLHLERCPGCKHRIEKLRTRTTALPSAMPGLLVSDLDTSRSH